MKYVPSIENFGSFFSSPNFYCKKACTTFSRVGAAYFSLLLCMSLADLPGSAGCALDAHKLTSFKTSFVT